MGRPSASATCSDHRLDRAFIIPCVRIRAIVLQLSLTPRICRSTNSGGRIIWALRGPYPPPVEPVSAAMALSSASSAIASCPKTGSAALCGLPPIVAQYAPEAFVASDRSLACLPERQRDDVVEAPW